MMIGCFAIPMVWTFAAYSQPAPLEYQVKASYLYNFMQFVVWPNDVFGTDNKFNLCVIGAERFGNALDGLADEKVDGHEIAVRRLEHDASPHAMQCHLLFVAGNTLDAPAAVLGERGVLTVGESPGFLGRGGVINLVQIQGRVRFEINQQAAKKAELVVSSRILGLAVNKP